ncbi:ABC transporter permease [Verrucomicrobiales bacterium]|jgi:putative ABC transport system permease protein|nr:ABC transporter permease [Verrucomicrobiales bacterium]
MLPFAYAVRNLFRDPARLLQTVGGAALVVFLLMTAAALNQGMNEVLSASGSPKNVILMGKGSEESIERSEVHLEAESIAATAIRGLQESLGQPAVSGEITYQAPLVTDSGHKEQGLLRGVTEKALLVHPKVRLEEGRFPGPGEVMVGILAHRKLGVIPEEVGLGKPVFFEDAEMTISGIFSAPGTVLESEVWFDRNDLAILTQRDSLSAVLVRLDGAEFEDVEVFTLQRNDLELAAVREDHYYEKLGAFYGPIRTMTWLTAVMVAAGAFFGGLNTLYAAFASRIRELATLQSIGFRRRSIFLSLVQESLLATLTGTLLALVLALLVVDGMSVPFSIGTFRLTLTPTVILVGLSVGVALGTVGILPPAWRTLSPALPKALRSN